MSDIWYVHVGDEQIGPLELSAVKRMAIKGELGPDDHVWQDGMPDWVPANSIVGLFPKRESPPLAQNPNLAPCPDCGKMVSKKAPQCPNCGRPLIIKVAETRLTVGRRFCQLGSALIMDVVLDGEHIFSLPVGDRGTTLVEPGEHLLSVTCGMSKAQTGFVVAASEHKQILVELFHSWFFAKIVFEDVHFEGFYDR